MKMLKSYNCFSLLLLLFINSKDIFSKDLIPKEIHVVRGKSKILLLPALKSAVKAEFKCSKDWYYPVFSLKNKDIVVLYADYEEKPNTTFTCVYSDINYKIIVDDYKYESETLKVKPNFINPSKKELAQIAQDTTLLNSIHGANSSISSHLLEFKSPFASLSLSSDVLTSAYGKERVFNEKRESSHLGTDYKADVKTKIYAVAAGKVVLAQNLYFSGNSVIIDHGQKLFTLYAHLSKIDVKVSDDLKAGDYIGLSGKTGRVTGPHLHLGLRVAKSKIDPIEFMNQWNDALK
jgi:murein DD-endopeptidase MepM/ murein hydrolase activator NlpD